MLDSISLSRSLSCVSIYLCLLPLHPGAAEAPDRPLLVPAAARGPGPPQQGAPAEERSVRQAHAQEQAKDQEDGETGDGAKPLTNVGS